MLLAQIGETLGSKSGATGSHILVSTTDAFDGFSEVLALPFQISGHNIVEGHSRVLSASFGVFFQLRLALRIEWDHIHSSRSFPPTYRRGSASEGKKQYIGVTTIMRAVAEGLNARRFGELR
jgi:hypothetical protein